MSSVMQDNFLQDSKKSPLAQRAAQLLYTPRALQQPAQRLPAEYRPGNFDQAWCIQQALTGLRTQHQSDHVVGYKCGLPFGQDGQNKVLAPIFARGVHTQSPCKMGLQNGACAFEPELGFTLKHPLPARTIPYTQEQITAAIGQANLVLELIENRYEPSLNTAQNTQPVSFYEQLADGLFHQGVWIGPQVPLDLAFNARCIDFNLTQQAFNNEFTTGLKTTNATDTELAHTESFSGQHPNKNPLAPLFWLVSFLNQQGIDLPAGQMIITGSYAGLLSCPPNQTLTLTYGTLGQIVVSFVEKT